MTKKTKIIPGQILIQDKIKSSSGENVYTVTFFDNCVSCTCPAGGKRQICKHIQKFFYDNLEFLKEKAPLLVENLSIAFEAKNDKTIQKELKQEIYSRVVFSDKYIATESHKNEKMYKVEQLNIQKQKNKKVSILLNTATALFLIGIILFFIKTIIGILCFVLSFTINFYIQKKYPDEFRQIIANGSAPAAQNVFKLKHVEGLKFFDNNSDIKISMPDKKIIFISKDKTQEININEIEHAAILEEITNDIKDKSVVARTLVGGLLLGGVGAVVGGLSGVTPTFKKNKTYYLQIKTKTGDDIVLTGKNNVLKTIKELIVKNV